MTATTPQYMEITAAARRLGVSDSLLRKLERQGRIPLAPRTAGGQRLYTVEAIEAIRTAREAARGTRQGAA